MGENAEDSRKECWEGLRGKRWNLGLIVKISDVGAKACSLKLKLSLSIVFHVFCLQGDHGVLGLLGPPGLQGEKVRGT